MCPSTHEWATSDTCIDWEATQKQKQANNGREKYLSIPFLSLQNFPRLQEEGEKYTKRDI